MTSPQSSGVSRRRFLRRTVAAAALPMIVPGSVLGLRGAVAPSNRIGFGIIGFGNRARETLPTFLSFPEIQYVAVSDCREDRRKGGKQMVDNRYGNNDCKEYEDFRELLARKDVDAVSIATGTRWHGIASMYAARAGKDIYCEKPVSLTIAEGRALVNTCRAFGTVYQAGTQRRSTASYRFAVEMVRQGRIGRLSNIEMQVWTGPEVPHEKPAPVPAGWNYDMWLGQSPWYPFVPGRVNSWQCFWDTSDGLMTDMGCHYTDQMQWALNCDNSGPVEFEAKAEFPDPVKYCSDTPVTGVARCTYPNGVNGIMYQRKAFDDRYIKFVGEEGWIQVSEAADVVTAEPKSILSLRAAGGSGWGETSDHIRDLLSCIRKRSQTICNPEVAHRAITICQAWTISMRLGRKLSWDPVKEKFDLEEANRMLAREPRAPWRI